MTKIIDKQSGKKIIIDGVLPSIMTAPELKTSIKLLPKTVDMRPSMTVIEDQSWLNSCVGNAVASCFEYFRYVGSGDSRDISRLFIYWNARKADGVQGDVGCRIFAAIKTMTTIGSCFESTYPYKPENVKNAPDSLAYIEAKDNKINEYYSVPNDLKSIKSCLASGYPIVFSAMLYPNFYLAKSTGIIPLPKGTELGRHAMLICGYDEQNQVFIVRNSWGINWGDLGYCYFPYDYMDSHLCNDFYTFNIKDQKFNYQSFWSDQSIDFILGDIFDNFGEDYFYELFVDDGSDTEDADLTDYDDNGLKRFSDEDGVDYQDGELKDYNE